MRHSYQPTDMFLSPDVVFTAPQILKTLDPTGSSQNASQSLKRTMIPSASIQSTQPSTAKTIPETDLIKWADFLHDLSITHSSFGGASSVYADNLSSINNSRRKIIDRYLTVENSLLKEMADPLYKLVYPPQEAPLKREDNTSPMVLPAEWLVLARRIRQLKTDAVKSNEPFSEASEKALKSFLKSLPFGKAPSIFLMESGNLRAVWRGIDRRQIALQFRDEDDLQFVFFFKRNSEQIRPAYGRDSAEGIIRQIEAFNLSGLLF